MGHEKDIEILTPRLFLRVPRMKDAVEINAAMNDVWDDLQLWMSWAFDGEETIEATKRYIAGVEAAMEKGDLPLLGFDRISGKLAVSTGIHVRNDHHVTGYWVAKDFLGKGLATEAANAVILYAFNEMGIKNMRINFYEGNEKSRRVIEKLGFKSLGVEKKGHVRCSNGMLIDSHWYEMRDPAVLPPLDVTWGPQAC